MAATVSHINYSCNQYEPTMFSHTVAIEITFAKWCEKGPQCIYKLLYEPIQVYYIYTAFN